MPESAKIGMCISLCVMFFGLGGTLGIAVSKASWEQTVAPLCEAHGGLVSPAQTVYLYPDACVKALTDG